MKLSERRKWVVCAHPLKKVPVSNWKILTEKRTGPQSEEKKSRRTSDCGVPHVHARQLREMLEHLDVACRVAVASTNGERGMRPQGREVEKRVGSVLSVTPYNGKIRRKRGLVRNYMEKKKVPSYLRRRCSSCSPPSAACTSRAP